MSKKQVLIAALIVVAIPLSVSAFSWRSLLFWNKSKTTTPKEQPVELPQKLTYEQEKIALNKIRLWQEAFIKKDWNKLNKDKNNFILSELEINFLLQDALKRNSDFPAKDIFVSLSDNEIKIDGQLLKPITGKFETLVTFDNQGETIIPVVKKMKLKGFTVPKSLANQVIQKYFPQASQFLLTYPNYQDADLLVNDNQLELKFR